MVAECITSLINAVMAGVGRSGGPDMRDRPLTLSLIPSLTSSVSDKDKVVPIILQRNCVWYRQN